MALNGKPEEQKAALPAIPDLGECVLAWHGACLDTAMHMIDCPMISKTLQLFNSLGRELREFTPIDPDHVRVYSCGPTVYNYAHIGNLRAYVFVDVLRRTLAWKGYDVTHVINITDVGHLTSDADEGDDKMEAAATRDQKSVWDIAAHYTLAFKNDLQRLNILPPSLWSKATDHIQEMIAFAKVLERNGTTYMLEDGLYFDSSKVPDYGRLGLLNLEGQEAGKRVAHGGKKNLSDFAVWRKSPTNAKRLMEWQSPWGTGAPGWHLECSVMAAKYLGKTFDIHTGGIDHRSVHHCNEIAQNQGYSQCSHPGANWWMHNEFLVLRAEGGDEKMSKSSGNFLTLQSLVDRGIHPLVYRLFLLSASYRSSIEFSWEALAGTRAHLRRMLLRIARVKENVDNGTMQLAKAITHDAHFQSGGPFTFLIEQLTNESTEEERNYILAVDQALSSDLHTPEVLVVLGKILDDPALTPQAVIRLVALVDLVLGTKLLDTDPDALSVRPLSASISEDTIIQKIVERTEARRLRDFARADQIREELLAAGVEIKDTTERTDWEWRVTPHES